MEMNTFPIIFHLIIFEFFSVAINPIIIIPGMGGNHMEAKLDKDAEINHICRTIFSDYFTIWLNAAYTMSRTPYCLFDVLTLTYDNVTRNTSNVYGVHTRIPGFGHTETIEYLDNLEMIWPYFSAFVKRMSEQGYVPGLSLRAAPFDFRKGPSEQIDYFNNVKTLIEETYKINDNLPIILMGHSLGGLLSFEFLNRQTQEWKNKYILFLIALAPSWGGCVKALESYVQGVTLRGTEFTPTLFNLSKSHIKYKILPSLTTIPSSMTRRLPSLIWQFPWPQLWDASNILVQTNEKSYTIENIEELFKDLGEPDGWEMYRDVVPFMKNLEDPGVRLYCIYGFGIQTVESIYYSGTILDSFTRATYGKGDGIVNLRSLEVCKQWKNTITKPFWGINHVTIATDPHVHEYIVSLVNSN